MLKVKQKPTGGKPVGQATDRRENKLIPPQYSRFSSKSQSIRPLSDLLDLALERAEYHESEANLHAEMARRHRAVLRSLQGLIPNYSKKLITEGDVTDE